MTHLFQADQSDTNDPLSSHWTPIASNCKVVFHRGSEVAGHSIFHSFSGLILRPKKSSLDFSLWLILGEGPGTSIFTFLFSLILTKVHSKTEKSFVILKFTGRELTNENQYCTDFHWLLFIITWRGSYSILHKTELIFIMIVFTRYFPGIRRPFLYGY